MLRRMIEINKNPSARELRQFGGIWFPLTCAIMGAGAYSKGHHLAGIIIWSIGLTTGALSVASPAALKPLYLGLMYVTFPIGFVVTHLLLGVLYYLVITPLGLVMRMMRRDAMTRRLDPAAASYWMAREPATGNERYFRQY